MDDDVSARQVPERPDGVRVGAVHATLAVVAVVDHVKPVGASVLGGDEDLVRGHADAVAASGVPDALDLDEPLLPAEARVQVVPAALGVDIGDGVSLHA